MTTHDFTTIDSPDNINHPAKLKPSERYQHSPATCLKQQSLSDILHLHMRIVGHTLKKHTWAKQGYFYLDLNAGPGIDPEGKPGSPLIAIQSSIDMQMPFSGTFCEADPPMLEKLRASLAGYNGAFRVVPYDNRTLDQHIKGDNRQYGIAYCDPSNAAVPWDTLRWLSSAFRYQDILISLACASWKRQRNLPHYQPLKELLLSVKPIWLIREPVTQFQWVMLLGTGNPNIREWKNRGWYRFDSEQGRDMFERATEIRSDIDRRNQRGLFDGE